MSRNVAVVCSSHSMAETLQPEYQSVKNYSPAFAALVQGECSAGATRAFFTTWLLRLHFLLALARVLNYAAFSPPRHLAQERHG
jgi:hypothetical protein